MFVTLLPAMDNKVSEAQTKAVGTIEALKDQLAVQCVDMGISDAAFSKLKRTSTAKLIFGPGSCGECE